MAWITEYVTAIGVLVVEVIADPDHGWLPWIAGTTFAVVACQVAQHERRLAEQLRTAQAGLAERARVEERNRIAHEIHDAVAHALTVSLLHISSARLALDEDVAEASHLMAEAEKQGRLALTEVRQAVGLLRQDGQVTDLLPGADQLGRLVDTVRGAGVDVQFETSGPVTELPNTTGVVLYRILQEALTNSVRHAPGAKARCRLQVQPTTVTLTVETPLAPPITPITPTAPVAGGTGLASMRARAEALGGTCTAGPRRRHLAGRRGAAAARVRPRGDGVIRVLLVDDQDLIRAGLRGLLRSRFGFEIVGECVDGSGVVAAVAETAPDIVLMDVRMPVLDGVQATRALQQLGAAPPVLILTTFDDDEILAAALRAGASGFLLKGVPAADLQKAVRTVADGGAWLDPAVTARVLQTYRSAAPSPPTANSALAILTAREREVLILIARGATNIEIAAELVLSEGTVKTHIGHLFTKLDVRDRAAAIVFAFDTGLVQPGPR